MKTLDELEQRIASVTKPADLFGVDPDAELKRLLAFCHPDRHPKDAVRAQSLFIHVQALFELTKEPLQVIKSPKRSYTLLTRKYVGDVSDIYQAESEGHHYLVKVSRVAGAERMLDRERQVLTEIHTAAEDAKYRCYFPLLVESFPAHSKFKRRVNVFAYELGWFSLEEVLHKYPHGLGGRHIVWIFKRLLTALGFAHRQDIIHGAVLPCHVLVRPSDHAVRLVGWGQAVKLGGTINSVPSVYKADYPTDAKKPVKSGGDILLAANCLRSALQASSVGSLQLTKFLHGCCIPGQWQRDEDAWKIYDEFTELSKSLYESKFVPLEM